RIRRAPGCGNNRSGTDAYTHYGLASIQLLHHRLECGVAEELPLVIGHHADAVHLEGIERVLNLAQGTADVRKRHGREHPEPARMVRNDLGAELVGLAGELSRSVEIAKENAGSLMDNIAVTTHNPGPYRRSIVPRSISSRAPGQFSDR